MLPGQRWGRITKSIGTGFAQAHGMIMPPAGGACGGEAGPRAMRRPRSQSGLQPGGPRAESEAGQPRAGFPRSAENSFSPSVCLQIDAQSHTAEDLVTEATKPKPADVPVQPWHGRSPSTWRGPHPNRSRWTPSDPARRGRVCCVVGATGPRAEPTRPSPLDSVGNVDSRIK